MKSDQGNPAQLDSPPRPNNDFIGFFCDLLHNIDLQPWQENKRQTLTHTVSQSDQVEAFIWLTGSWKCVFGHF